MTKNQLHCLADQYKREMDERVIQRIVHQVYNRVVHTAGNGLGYSTTWNPEDYIFDDPGAIRHIHTVTACTRLQNLFPDSKISRTPSQQICVEWI